MSAAAATAPERRLKNYKEAAAYLGISVRGFQDIVRDGHVMKVPIGHRILFDKVDLDEYVERLKKSA